jgi:hypothetical protein
MKNQFQDLPDQSLKNPQKSNDAPHEPVSPAAKKTLSVSVWIWIALIFVLCSIPLVNFVAVPIVASIGILAFALYHISKLSKARSNGTDEVKGPVSGDYRPPGNSDGSSGRPTPPDNFVSPQPGLKTANPKNSERLKKSS